MAKAQPRTVQNRLGLRLQTERQTFASNLA